MTRAAALDVLYHAIDHVAMTSRPGADPDSEATIILLSQMVFSAGVQPCVSIPEARQFATAVRSAGMSAAATTTCVAVKP